MFEWMKKKKQSQQEVKSKPIQFHKNPYHLTDAAGKVRSITIPSDWLVYEFGQEPMFALWGAVLLNLDKRLSVSVIEQDSMFDAIKSCIDMINAGKTSSY